MPETQNILPVGTVVRIPERKKTIYKITDIYEHRRDYVIRRCLPTPGYPLSGDRTVYRYSFDDTGRMTVLHMGGGSAAAPAATQERPAPAEAPAAGLRETRLADLAASFCPDCIVNTYRMIECSLSPENLTCDGELPESEVAARSARLHALKNALDAYTGCNVALDC